MNPIIAVLLLSLMSLATTWIGVALAIRVRESARAVSAGIGFSVGIMLLISVLELVPEAHSRLGWGPTLLGFVAGAGLVWAAHRSFRTRTSWPNQAWWTRRSSSRSIW